MKRIIKYFILKLFYTRYLVAFNGIYKNCNGDNFISYYIKDIKGKITCDKLMELTEEIKELYKDTFSECFIISYQKINYSIKDITK